MALSELLPVRMPQMSELNFFSQFGVNILFICEIPRSCRRLELSEEFVLHKSSPDFYFGLRRSDASFTLLQFSNYISLIKYVITRLLLVLSVCEFFVFFGLSLILF